MSPTAKKPFIRTKRIEGEPGVLAKIAEMPGPFAAMGKRVHAVIMAAAPHLVPNLHYGMPWYSRDGKRVCFFRVDRYMTFGLTEDATLQREPGAAHQLMTSAWFFRDLDAATEVKIAELVRAAAS